MTDEIRKDELLNDEQLDQVSGGTWDESAVDEKFFKKLGYNMNKITIEDAFNANGIKFTQGIGSNGYEFFVKDPDGFNATWVKHPHFAALGRVLERRRYPGFTGSWTDAGYVKSFLKEHFGITDFG